MPCGYNPGGLASIQVMDVDDFVGLRFKDDGLEDSALVEKIYGRNPIAVPVSTSSRYAVSKTGRIYSHQIDTYISGMSATLIASLELAARRDYAVIFTAKSGARFFFGYDAGAKISYNATSSDGLGPSVIIAARSKYPIFELMPSTIVGSPRATFDVDFNLGAYCAFNG